MSNEIKQGDKVRVREDAPRVYLRNWDKAVEYDVYAVDGDAAAITYGYQEIAIPLKYLVKVDAEAKEAKFKVGDRVEELVSRKIGRVLGIEGDFVVVGFPYDEEKNYWHIDSVELVEPTEQTEVEKLGSITEETIKDKSYWDAYAADLVKEVALKVANKFNDPKEAAEYAVSVAKAVVEGLKRK